MKNKERREEKREREMASWDALRQHLSGRFSTGEFQRLDEGVLEEVSKCPLGIKEI